VATVAGADGKEGVKINTGIEAANLGTPVSGGKGGWRNIRYHGSFDRGTILGPVGSLLRLGKRDQEQRGRRKDYCY